MQQKQQVVNVTTGQLADIGVTRKTQQDSLGYVNIPAEAGTIPVDFFRKGHLYVLADGVGGSDEGTGGLASRIAVEAIIEKYYTDPSPDIAASLKNALIEANRQILVEREKRHLYKMQTTVVCCVVVHQTLYVADVGDSRLYRINPEKGALKRLTTDHVQEKQNVLTRALGYGEDLKIDLITDDILPGDILLLCSDGLYYELDDNKIYELVGGEPEPQAACALLVEQAKLAGGQDNISLIVSRVGELQNFAGNVTTGPIQPEALKNFSHTNLAPTGEFPTPESPPNHNDQKKPVLSAATMAIFLLLILIIAGQAVWSQYRYRAVQTDLENSQKILSTIRQDVETLRLEYEQEAYGPANPALLDGLEHIENRLKKIPNSEETPHPTATPIILSTATPTSNSTN